MEFNELMQQFAAKVGLSELTPVSCACNSMLFAFSNVPCKSHAETQRARREQGE